MATIYCRYSTSLDWNELDLNDREIERCAPTECLRVFVFVRDGGEEKKKGVGRGREESRGVGGGRRQGGVKEGRESGRDREGGGWREGLERG